MIEKIAGSLQIKPHLLFGDEHEADTRAAALQPLPGPSGMTERAKDALIKNLTATVTRIVKKQ
ncbi:MAG: hypothetical protein LBI86_09940 [Treponema sp.]|jgi:hypothetical protein|nr:hypothetical protein [Treponema sp.]